MTSIHVQVEPRRGCGYRRVGKNGFGIYLVAPATSAPCGQLPFPVHVCPTCGAGIKRARGWTWITPRALFGHLPVSCHAKLALAAASAKQPFGRDVAPDCVRCPIGGARPEGKHGLLWIGEKFYATPLSFTREAAQLGVSRKLSQLPRGFQLGQSWVFLAHARAVFDATRAPPGSGKAESEAEESRTAESKQLSLVPDGAHVEKDAPARMLPGIFTAFRPQGVDIVVEAERAEDIPEAALKLQDRLGERARFVRVIREEDAQTDLDYADEEEDEGGGADLSVVDDDGDDPEQVW